jgi:hypothetical protein
MEFEKQLKELEIRLPTNINEAYLYYKYIVRKSQANFLEDFNMIIKPSAAPPPTRIGAIPCAYSFWGFRAT